MILTRRSFLGVLPGALAAPLVVRSGLLMPVKALEVPTWMRCVAEGEELLGLDVGTAFMPLPYARPSQELMMLIEWVRTHLDTVYRFSA